MTNSAPALSCSSGACYFAAYNMFYPIRNGFGHCLEREEDLIDTGDPLS